MTSAGRVEVDWEAKEHSLRCISVDENDRDLDNLIQFDPYNGDSPSRRSDRELARILDFLDSLESGEA